MNPNELMDWDDIARVYRTTRRHVRDVIVKRVDFPKPVKGSGVRNPLYLAEAVRAYMVEETVA
jgi:hypothetical protein